jgi:hypothetical protein
MVDCDTPRGLIETTFQECREYLARESTRGYGQQTVLRFTPCLFGLYTMVVLLPSTPTPLKHSQYGLLEGQIDGDVFRYDHVRPPCIMGAVVFSHTG